MAAPGTWAGGIGAVALLHRAPAGPLCAEQTGTSLHAVGLHGASCWDGCVPPRTPWQLTAHLQESWGELVTRAGSDCTRGNGFEVGECRLRAATGKRLGQVPQRVCDCPLPGGLQGQAGWGCEQPGLLGGVPARDRDSVGFKKVPSSHWDLGVLTF